MRQHLSLLGLAAALLAAPRPARTQQLTFPHLEWRTLETPHFVIHYPSAATVWTLDMARRLEAVHQAVASLVGSAPAARVTVVVEDPNGLANGFAIPFLDAPLMVFWPTPPDPGQGIGDNRSWAEILSTHEFAHLAHLTRPSRNPLRRLLATLAPVHLGPIAFKSPRWLTEGYATYIEGKLTGLGRPHSAWRAAVLREWALQGKLPTYGQLSGDPRFLGGSMAYLVGSAYLEWLVDRSGDSSLVHLWRRMSARRDRSFASAFAGVFGGYPDDLYGRFAAELTGKALAVEGEARAALGPNPPDSGAGRVVQRLEWNTGRPAVSADGALLALVLRSRNAPSRVVVWKTAEEPVDSNALRAQARELRLDPEDVPAIPWRPRPKTAVATLYPQGGVPFDEPRFLPDGRRLLVVRFTGRGDGVVRSDLYVWNFETSSLRRVTHGAGIQHPDPAPDGRFAVADRCHEGICDVVRVDLATGRLVRLAAGSPHRVYQSPRYAPDGRRIAVSVHEAGRWRVALLPIDADTVGPIRFVDPDDGANRYDPAFLPDGSSLVLTSDAGGIQNLEVLDLSTGSTRRLTQVTSAALGPEPDPVHGTVYFLHLHPEGFDLNVIASGIVRPAPATAAPALAPAAPIPPERTDTFATTPLPRPRSYGIGPRQFLFLPAASVGAEGKSVGVMLSTTDPVGRFTGVAQGLYGDRGTWRGGALGFAWRGMRPELAAQVFSTEDEPSEQHGGVAVSPALDVRYRGGTLAATLIDDRLTNVHRVRLGVSAGTLDGPQRDRHARLVGFLEYSGAIRQSPHGWTLVEQVGLHGSTGRTAGATWSRAIVSAALVVGQPRFAIAAEGAYGVIDLASDPFEQFTLGGTPPPLFDAALLAQRFAMPALPVGVAAGRHAAAYRLTLPGAGLRPYFWSGSAGETLRTWHHVVGLEWAYETDGIWLVRVPGVRVQAGVGYSLSEPFRHETRGYVTLAYRP
jgi:hypothetical protein